MRFDVRPQHIRSAALEMTFYAVPWDTEILGVPVGQVGDITIHKRDEAAGAYAEFSKWCDEERIQLCTCRIASDRLVESIFLEDQGFRFIELNYTPRIDDLMIFEGEDSDVRIEAAGRDDEQALANMAGQVFRHGRLHQDPRIDSSLGDRRYRAWMAEAFCSPSQHVLKCTLNDALTAFFVVEYPNPAHCFWSLIALAPGMEGRGLGKRIWRAVLGHHRRNGICSVSTSISSLNSPVLNLYVALGFRFPPPAITLHWRPTGASVLR
jgi:GNAT superfamily N-acetyltransferase